MKHDFLAKRQAEKFVEIKENLKEGEYLVALDFSENYAFKIQDAIQSYHWTNDQATLHPYVVYYKNSNEIQHDSFVVISEYLKHDAVSVHLFNKKLINFLIMKHGTNNVRKLFYFSDGAASQYKNKSNFINLVYYKTDFDLDVE